MSSWSRFLESESPSHRQVRETLSYLARDINSLGVYEFDLQQLEKLNIDVVPMTLDETSPHKPSYFAPHTGDMIPEPTKDNLGEAYTGFDDETEASFTGPADRAYWMGEHLSRYISYYIFRVSEESVPWISGDVGDSAFLHSALFKYTQPEFGCDHIAEPIDPAYPHVKAIMYNDMIPTDSTIIYGELIPILRIMWTQTRRSKFLPDSVIPVLLFSLAGSQARVIEAFFRGDRLILRRTEFYECRNGNHNAFKTLALWYLGKPIWMVTQPS